jgi:hypothetical protein
MAHHDAVSDKNRAFSRKYLASTALGIKIGLYALA